MKDTIALVLANLMAILLLVIGFCFIKGKYLRSLADFDPTKYTEKQGHLIGKVAGVYYCGGCSNCAPKFNW
ncbi:hypothetical protein AB0Y04_10690 [Loigolactobacillus coryniformis]|uniref:Uncharacterized protein n=2 Tax=Loigolactobacillus coryniformis TaxID=1610 RepID=A0A0R1EYP5_9LACO|nr:hypothetical protein [Loigolactobacillus coryniformis]KRK14664.1 hypothetical protein FD22_GL002230 [Loigolactobacillus coryniformis subsp. coryniformis KCTC 3167 = DSM 20001]MBW4802812.1 hypothetical protein [Loigolactobacillus coryniformis subsp. torquens]MBW4805502.1 hypothetical protein [Loigolactobacillus coryniformis subsp. torquens]MCL5458503.1 hypothetical protein [Loigolactobacillus coryniformis]